MAETSSTKGSGESKPVSTSPSNSSSFAEQSKSSTKRWRVPKNVRELAAQANEVATMFLNGDLEIDTARTYSTIARVVAQAASTEVARSRFLKERPDLSLTYENDE